MCVNLYFKWGNWVLVAASFGTNWGNSEVAGRDQLELLIDNSEILSHPWGWATVPPGLFMGGLVQWDNALVQHKDLSLVLI